MLEAEFIAQVHVSYLLMVEDSIRLPGGDDATFIHYVGMVANAQSFTHIVVCYQYANTTRTQLPDDLLDIHNRDRVNTGKRLVQQDKARIGCQCAGNFNSSPFPPPTG